MSKFQYNLKIETVLTKNLQKEWDVLWGEAANAHYFNSVSWIKTCSAAFSKSHIQFLTVRQNSKLVSILPLITERKFLKTFLVNPGEKYIDRSALLIKENSPELLFEIVNFLQKKGSFYLSELPEDVLINMPKANIMIKSSSVNMYLPFENGPFTYLDKEQKRKIRKVLRENEGRFRFVMNRGSRDAFQIAIDIDRRSYKEKKGWESFNSDYEIEFFKTLIEKNGDSVGINILYYSDVPVAYEIGIRFAGIYYGLNKSFDNNYKKIIPGKVLAYLLFQGLFEEGISMFDFSRGQDHLKKSFSPLSKKQYDIYYIDNFIVKLCILSFATLKDIIVNNKKLYFVYKKAKALNF